MLLAIVIPLFNPGPEFAEALSSIIAEPQTSVVIVVDDGSDVPVTIDELYCNVRVKIIRSVENIGVAGALNLGIEEAIQMGATFIARVDGDDICVKDRFDRQIQVLQSKPDLMIIGSRVFYMSPKGDVFGESLKLTRKAARIMLYFDNPLPHPTWMLRTELFEKYGKYDEKYDLVEDYEFLRRVLKHEEFFLMEEALVYYRVHDRSVSKSKRCRQLNNLLKVQRRYFEFRNVWAYLGFLRTTAFILACPAARALPKMLRAITGPKTRLPRGRSA